MAARRAGQPRIHPAWWTLILIAVMITIATVTSVLFTGSLNSSVPVTLNSDRAGLVMETGAKVKLRGVEVGKVAQIQPGDQSVSLELDIDPDQVKYIPANVQARIRATTAFGAKYVDLIPPDDPSPKRIGPGTVIKSQNVSTEVNTVFQNLTDVLHQIDPAKLNGTLTALAEGLRGQGQRLGEAVTDGDQVLAALNPRSDTIRADWQAFKGFSDTYGAAAPHILRLLDALTTTSATITTNQKALDALLLSAIGLSDKGIELLGPNRDNLITAINSTEPTTSLLMKYNPELTCMLVGGKLAVDTNWGYVGGGGNGKSAILDAALLLGDDPYKYPDNLPVVGARGGPGGKPGCGSLPDAAQNWPVRYLVTDTGWGTGLDMRPNPGIGFPGYLNYLPVTRGTPEPPSIRYPGGPAPGPIPYPGAPPYGAPQYSPDGTPQYPGLGPPPPPGAPREAGPRPGSEPFVVPDPGQTQPTPSPPLPEQAAPAP
ncbi:virulence factor [Mycobacterium saskatchewanense]|uniref:MCE-family protein MCE3A n=1 Tax=Mycobacterium saskatchewanense TaxID=220927 RepID=A0AAJ3NTU2_9MYCO|nr:MCE family protein [Mycobacterium saskatchewanense]ORW73735.1 MCE-family protein MCE3A [Mycobacterium saskatchewanense]BBX65148.1 virulence factor [Mycobacterium saskatchewanense]